MELPKPRQLHEFIINKHVSDKLALFNINNLQNIILYGKKNRGKKTLIYAFIRHLFNIDSHIDISVQKITKTYKHKSSSYICSYNRCNYYYEIDFLENIKVIKHIINHFIIDLCSNKTVHNTFRIVILRNIDVIYEENIRALSYIIETFYKYNKFIIISNNSNMHFYKCKIMNLCCPIKCYIHKKEIENYLKDKKIKCTKKSKTNILNSDTLFEIMMIIQYKTLPKYDPIQIFLNKIHTLLIKSQNILFISKLKTYIYDIYLLNYNLQKIPIQYIKYISKKKNISDTNLHILYHKANIYNCSNTFELFSFIENFFIEIKINNLF